MKKSILALSLTFIAVLALSPAAQGSTAVITTAPGPFTTDLFFGVQASIQVKALQQLLTTQGLYAGPITGNFLNLTMQSVKEFQIENNVIPSTGYFGPLTRAKANAIAAATISLPSTSSSTNKTAPIAIAPTTDILAYMQIQLAAMFSTVRNLEERFFNKNQSSSGGSSSPSVPATTITAPTSVLVLTTTTQTGTASPAVKISTPAPALSQTTTTSTPAGATPSAPVPATTTLTLTIVMSGGSAQANNFNVLIKDNAVSSIIFSGSGSSSTQRFTLTQGHSYVVSETASANALNYTVALSAGCSGVVTKISPACAITNTYSPPTGSGSASVPNSSSSGGSTSTNPTTETSGLSWGAYSGDSPSSLASLQSLVGASPNIQAIFLSLGVDSFPTGYTQSVGAAGKTLLIFWEPDNGSDDVSQSAFSYSSILSGTYDANMTQFAAAAKAYGYPVILVPMDEMNGNWEPWGGTVNGNTPAQFTQVWIHIHNLFAGVSNVKFGWDPNNDSVPDTSANAISAYWPGAQYVDYVGVDGFNGNGDPWQSFSQIFPSSLMTQLAAYGKPVYIFSMGSTEESSNPLAKAQWITQGLGPNGIISTFPDIAGWIWFNENGGDSTSNWLINSDAASLAAFQAAIP
jgi:Glycosyl hydrolase family 26/Putative peptidoglycan binding domain